MFWFVLLPLLAVAPQLTLSLPNFSSQPETRAASKRFKLQVVNSTGLQGYVTLATIMFDQGQGMATCEVTSGRHTKSYGAADVFSINKGGSLQRYDEDSQTFQRCFGDNVSGISGNYLVACSHGKPKPGQGIYLVHNCTMQPTPFSGNYKVLACSIKNSDYWGTNNFYTGTCLNVVPSSDFYLAVIPV